MTQGLRIGYIVPQCPGQTHIFFWREIRALEAMGGPAGQGVLRVSFTHYTSAEEVEKLIDAFDDLL